MVGSYILYRLAIELSLKIVSLFKAFQLSVSINHSNFKLRLRLSLKNNWYYLQLYKERLPLLTADSTPVGLAFTHGTSRWSVDLTPPNAAARLYRVVLFQFHK